MHIKTIGVVISSILDGCDIHVPFTLLPSLIPCINACMCNIN